MMSLRMTLRLFLVVALVLTTANAAPQKMKKKPARYPQAEAAERVAAAKDDVAIAADNYMESLKKLLASQEGDVKTAEETVQKRKARGRE